MHLCNDWVGCWTRNISIALTLRELRIFKHLESGSSLITDLGVKLPPHCVNGKLVQVSEGSCVSLMKKLHYHNTHIDTRKPQPGPCMWHNYGEWHQAPVVHKSDVIVKHWKDRLLIKKFAVSPRPQRYGKKYNMCKLYSFRLFSYFLFFFLMNISLSSNTYSITHCSFI